LSVLWHRACGRQQQLVGALEQAVALAEALQQPPVFEEVAGGTLEARQSRDDTPQVRDHAHAVGDKPVRLTLDGR
jgi:hypothetical protein